MKADYPSCIINSIINEFQKGKDYEDESFTIPADLFGITKPLISIEIPYSEHNKFKSKHFLKILLRACILITKRITRSLNIVGKK